MDDTILVVEDDKDILELIEWNLREEGYEVLSADNGAAGLAIARKELPDLVILDIMLPEMDGLDVCRNLKNEPKTRSIPVIMLTAKGQEVDRIVGFELGAEDYIVKPFSPREMVLRVRAILRRRENSALGPPVTRYKNLRIDEESHRVFLNEKEIFLTLTEFNLLLELLKNAGKVLTRDQLLDRVWGYSFEGYARTVDTHVRRLRKKLGDHAEAVETVRGVGYRIKKE